MSNLLLFSGNANLELATKIAQHLDLPLGRAIVDRFSDYESRVEILENVRGKETFIIQSSCSPANEHIMELIIMADALYRASAARITAVMPYFGYARQDRRVRSSRVPISAKVVADILTSVGINRVLTVDLHSEQIQGFFSIPVDNIFSTPLFLEDIKQKHLPNPLVVSPDVGGVIRARAFAKRIKGSGFAIIDKRRPAPNRAQIMHIIGDVSGHDCIIIDDMVDTAGTLCQAAQALKEQGARSVYGYCTHPILSGDAVNNIERSELNELVVSDTIPLRELAKRASKIRQISLSELLAKAIYRLNASESLSSLFPEPPE